jgi:uncharacterized protein (DUF488 family)
VILFTIGFTKKSAERFFTLLKEAQVRRVIDVRLNNRSQLAGYSKATDLEYFLRAIAGIEYRHVPELAPTQDLLDAYKKQKGSWSQYEERFLHLVRSRAVENSLDRSKFDMACLLCSEHQPEHCHRRLVAEYLKDKWGDIEIQHLV